MLIAEYRPQESKYYYYTPDQVNSTRIVTDDSGTEVYSAAFDPYGGIQKTWVNTYDPKLKFSGKERDADTGLDYFGARYYGYSSYRFISVDPVINSEEAISNPQLWNLYSYCRNNPVTFVDPDGETDVNINIFRKYAGSAAIMGEFSIQGTNISGYTLELPWRNNKEFESCIPLKSYEAEVYYSGKFSQYALKLLNVKGRKNISIHAGVDASDTLGYPLIGSEIDMAKERISGGKKLLKEMTDYIRTIQFIDYFFLHEQTNIQVNERVDYSYILNSFKTLIQSIPENLK